MTKIGLTALATVLLIGIFVGILPSGATNLQDSNAEATISALQTEVSQLKTQVATTAPTATATQAPRPTVPAELQVLADGLELLYYYTIEDGSSITILGEVRNTTDQWLDSPYLKIVFLDSDENIVDTDNFGMALVTIGPGESMPFETTIYDVNQDEWNHEEISVCDWPSDFYVSEGYGESPTLQLQDVEEIEKSGDRLHIEGKVFNSGKAPVERVEVNAFVYLSDGKYAGHDSTQIDVAIPPGKTARFTLDGGSYEIPGLDSMDGWLSINHNYTYRLWVGTEPNARVYSC